MSEVVKQIRFSSIRSFWLWSNWKKRSKHQLHVHLISQALLPASPASRRIIYPSIHPSTHLAEAVNASVVTMVIRFRWTNGLLGKVLLSASDDLYPRPFSPRYPCMSVSVCMSLYVRFTVCTSVCLAVSRYVCRLCISVLSVCLYVQMACQPCLLSVGLKYYMFVVLSVSLSACAFPSIYLLSFPLTRLPLWSIIYYVYLCMFLSVCLPVCLFFCMPMFA